MTDKTSALILEHLRVLRLEMGELRADVRDMRGRLTSLEVSVANLHGDFAGESSESKAVWSGSSTDYGCAKPEAASTVAAKARGNAMSKHYDTLETRTPA